MIINGLNSALIRVLLEVRYRNGYVYLDRCGRTLNKLLQDYPEWVIRVADPNATAVVSMQNGSVFNFSSVQYSLSLERPLGGTPLTSDDVTHFRSQVQSLSSVIHQALDLTDFLRIGFREWHLFAFESNREAETWLSELGCYQISPRIAAGFDGQVTATGVAIVVAGTDRSYRIALNAVERQAQLDLGQEILSVRTSALHKSQNKMLLEQQKAKRRVLGSPGFGAMLDIDVFQEDPPSIDPNDFVLTSMKYLEDRLPKAIAG